jgi:hypothetical protein
MRRVQFFVSSILLTARIIVPHNRFLHMRRVSGPLCVRCHLRVLRL